MRHAVGVVVEIIDELEFRGTGRLAISALEFEDRSHHGIRIRRHGGVAKDRAEIVADEFRAVPDAAPDGGVNVVRPAAIVIENGPLCVVGGLVRGDDIVVLVELLEAAIPHFVAEFEIDVKVGIQRRKGGMRLRRGVGIHAVGAVLDELRELGDVVARGLERNVDVDIAIRRIAVRDDIFIGDRGLVPRGRQISVRPIHLRAVVRADLVHEARDGKGGGQRQRLVGEERARRVARRRTFGDGAHQVHIGDAGVGRAGRGALRAGENEREIFGTGIGDHNRGRRCVAGRIVRAGAAGRAVDRAVAVGNRDARLAGEAQRVGAVVKRVAFPHDERAILGRPVVAVLGAGRVAEMGGGVPVGPTLAHGVGPEPIAGEIHADARLLGDRAPDQKHGHRHLYGDATENGKIARRMRF